MRPLETWACVHDRVVVLPSMLNAGHLPMAATCPSDAPFPPQASRILSYLGDHLMLLTTMNLRDYLLLKVGLPACLDCLLAWCS